MSESKSYKDLDIYTIGLDLFLKVHPLTLKLPKYECYELGSQLRRSADSVVSNILGYGRRRYKADFIRFLVFSHSSNLETVNICLNSVFSIQIYKRILHFMLRNTKN